jgi:hypothetical protein
MIFQEYPKAVEINTHGEILPLNFALMCNVSDDVTKMICQSYQKAVWK